MTTIDEILEQEDRLARAKRTLDLDAIDRIYADDLLLTGVLGDRRAGSPPPVPHDERLGQA